VHGVTYNHDACSFVSRRTEVFRTNSGGAAAVEI
jgi:hypothetical protein